MSTATNRPLDALAWSMALALGHTVIDVGGQKAGPNTRRLAVEVNNLLEWEGWRIVEDEPDHFVTFDEQGWFIEHSLDCRITGTIGTCTYNAAIREVYDEAPHPDDMGRWRITAVDDEGVPSLERAADEIEAGATNGSSQ